MGGSDVDDLVVELAVRDEPFLILIDDPLDLALGFAEQNSLRLRNDHVIHAYGHASSGGIVESEGAQTVGQKHSGLVSVLAVARVYQRRERLLIEGLVDQVERQPLR